MADNLPEISTSTVYNQAFLQDPSPLKAHVFKQYLQEYDKFEAALLLHDLEVGVRVPSTLLFDANAPIVENHQSAKVNEESVQKMITSNLEKGWIAGPFDNRPDQLIVSPLASIPKKDTDARRVIHNLSFPYKNSVNSHIHHDFCEVQYETIDVCVNILSSLGKGAEIAKGDVENAFYTMKLSVEGYHFMGFVWKGQFFFQKTL
ncbi:MAG: hypothetical protein GY705_04530, partial [Bacteroidetes bacterium]|nr:hypothetical protein [Bacteroidota bacterium]